MQSSSKAASEWRTFHPTSVPRAPSPLAGPAHAAVLNETADRGRLDTRRYALTRGPLGGRHTASISRNFFTVGYGSLLIEKQELLPTRLPGAPPQQYHPPPAMPSEDARAPRVERIRRFL